MFVTSNHQTTNLACPNYFHDFFSFGAVETINQLFIGPKLRSIREKNWGKQYWLLGEAEKYSWKKLRKTRLAAGWFDVSNKVLDRWYLKHNLMQHVKKLKNLKFLPPCSLMHDSSRGRLGCIIVWLTIFQACLSRICSDFIKYKTISMAAFFTCADSSTLRLVCARFLKIFPRSSMRKDKSSFLEPSTSKAWPTPRAKILFAFWRRCL